MAIVNTQCSVQIIGDRLHGCNDLSIVSYIDGIGALCDVETLKDEMSDPQNALIMDYDEKTTLKNAFDVISSLDPFILWSLVAILLTFVLLMFVSVYVCKICKVKNEDDDESCDAIAEAIMLAQKKKKENNKCARRRLDT